MNDERHSEREIERDSQLSAMFDGELPAAECELLARRLTRDDALRTQWSRYSMIGAALRAERGVKLDDRVAKRVQAALALEPTYGEAGDTATRPSVANAAGAPVRRSRFALPAVGAGIAAGVAAVSIFWLRGQDPQTETMLAAAPVAAPAAVVPASSGATVAPTVAARPVAGEADYITPQPSSQPNMVPPARLANYVVAHSEYSGPLSRRMALLSVVGSENATDTADGTEPAAGAETPDGQ